MMWKKIKVNGENSKFLDDKILLDEKWQIGTLRTSGLEVIASSYIWE